MGTATGWKAGSHQKAKADGEWNVPQYSVAHVALQYLLSSDVWLKCTDSPEQRDVSFLRSKRKPSKEPATRRQRTPLYGLIFDVEDGDKTFHGLPVCKCK
jgi:hypothetical protein